MTKKKKDFNWADNQIFDYQLISNPKENKSYLEKRKELIKNGELKCSEWWHCWRKN